MKKKHVLAFTMVAAALLATAVRAGAPELPVDLGSAGDFVILAGTGISTVPNSNITGDIGVSPAVTHTAITGFGALPLDPSLTYSTSPQVNGKIYAFDYDNPTPPKMVTATADMLTAFTQASLRTTPNTTELMGGDISGLTLTPGLHKWSTDVLVNSDVTLDAGGNADAIFIFQISGDLLVASGQSVLLAAGAQAKNIFWQIEGPSGAVIGTTAHVEGIVMTAKAIVVQTGASFNGKLLAQTAVTLDMNNIMDADLIPPPTVQLEILSAHGIGTPTTGVYVNVMGSLLTNSITPVETMGGTQYVNVGWAMIGNDPIAGVTNAMSMTHTNDAVLTWLWQTNYLFDASAGLGGGVTGDTNGFYAADSSVTVTAAPLLGFSFVGWTGDVTGSTNDLTQVMTMDQARTVVAHFVADPIVDPSNVVLQIISAHGVGTPATGSYVNVSGTLLTNSITSVETMGGTQYVNVGWAMIGNDPVAGVTNAMSMTHTNDAVLTWLWQTNYLFDASAGLGGGVTGDTNGFYAADSSVTVTAAPLLGFSFTGWTGDVSGSTNDLTQVMTMDQARTVVAHFVADPSNVVLQIISAHGIGTPATGVYVNVMGSLLTNSITSVETMGGTQYVNVGWAMIGNDPVAGVTNAMSMTHTNDAVLTWLWQTNYLFDASADSGGGITGDTNGFYAAGSTVTVAAAPQSGYAFVGWDVNGAAWGTGNPLTVTMDEAKNATAFFAGGFVDVSSNVSWSVTWVFNPRLGYFTGTLTIENTSSKSLMAPFWLEIGRTTRHWLRFPTGADANTGLDYLDITAAVTGQLPGIGNGNLALDPGESVTVTDIQLMGRREPGNVLIMALWADLPGTQTTPGNGGVVGVGVGSNGSLMIDSTVVAGSFDGYFYGAAAFNNEETPAVRGTLTLKISSTAGRLSAKAVLRDGYVSFRAGAWDDIAADGTCHVMLAARNGEILDLFVRGERIWGTLQGGKAGAVALELDGGRNRFADRGDAAAAALLEEFSGYYTVALPVYAGDSLGNAEAAPTGAGYLSVTVRTKGSVKVAGVLADGTRVSRSSKLILTEGDEQAACIPLFAPLYAKTGWIGGLLWLDPVTRTITTVRDAGWFVCWKKPGLGVADGFHLLLDACGGFYSPTAALAAGYLFGADADAPYWHTEGIEFPVDLPSDVPVAVVGRRLSVSRAATPVKESEAEDVWFTYDETNPTQAKLAFTLRTGIFKGSFTLYYDFETGVGLQHKAVKAPYAGILTPVRDPIFGELPSGMGHCLIPATDPAFQALRLKRSYLVWLEDDE